MPRRNRFAATSLRAGISTSSWRPAPARLRTPPGSVQAQLVVVPDADLRPAKPPVERVRRLASHAQEVAVLAKPVAPGAQKNLVRQLFAAASRAVDDVVHLETAPAGACGRHAAPAIATADGISAAPIASDVP